MKAAYASAFALAAALVSGHAAAEHPGAASVDQIVKVHAGEQAKSRDQVRAELRAAGTVQLSDQFGRTVAEAGPAGQPAAQFADTKARQDVRAEAATRDVHPSDQFGRTVAEAYPSIQAVSSQGQAQSASASANKSL
ncbi:hypothetical protein [Quisquiliibacterium transsilvanicum]|uniref:S-adenosylmethionine hydrolase n=1 Tax=Quisquiliibacterium transsilvanicum TaxID=1549638 RepID=A0A7W8M9P7_9BURK|nr:hypothetical protein [Quisquiliibacterium transsilvanicum]MBB5273266.1 S-adenosylmethionine hydrolase [Quisquiliibacterium transsilvanicum]